MEQALEFLEFCWRDVPMNGYAFESLELTITALRRRIASPARTESGTAEGAALHEKEMTELEKAARQALAFIRWSQFGECRTDGWDGPPPTAAATVASLTAALEQPAQCPGCEGNPSPENNPCAVCGKPAQQEPVTWMKPHPKCDAACMYQCTKGFTKFPECVYPIKADHGITGERK